MSTITFDTLTYANTLKAAGVESAIAEAHAKANAELFRGLIEDTLATKQDVLNLEQRLESKIDHLEHRLEDKIKILDHKLEDSIQKLHHKLEDNIQKLDHKIENLEHKLGNKIKDMETKLTLRLGTLMTVGIGIFGTMISLLHH